MNKILLAGATGYLGHYLLPELLKRGFATRALVRNEKKLFSSVAGHRLLEVVHAEVTESETIRGCCKGVEVVISTIGITRQKDGLTYMEVDYQANMNLLEEAGRSGVQKFIYVSVFQGDRLKKLKICKAKEKFVQALKRSGLDYCIIRPTGYFSDIEELLEMAKKGRAFLFGNGNNQMNPIHGADLAAFCINTITSDMKELAVGGPETFTFRQMAALAFVVLGKKPRITFIPKAIGGMALFLLRIFFSSKFYGPIEFMMTVVSRNMVAPAYGNHRLKPYFKSLI